MFAFVLFVLVFHYEAKRLAAKNVFKMTILCRVWRKTLINQSWRL